MLGVEEEVVVIELGNELSVNSPCRAQPSCCDRRRPRPTSSGCRRPFAKTASSATRSSKRLQHAQEKLRSGDPIDLAEIVRDGVKREQGRTATGTPIKLSTSERALHLKARELLAGEIEVARGIDRAAAEAWIDQQLAVSS